MEGDAPVIEARKSADFELSGDLRGFTQPGSRAVEINRFWDGRPADRLTTGVYCLWSETALYFGFSCPYEELSLDETAPLNQPRWQLWDLDIAEVLISPQEQPIDHYYEFEVAPTGHWIDLEVVFRDGRPFYNWDRRLNGGVRARVDAGRRVWTAELKIPIASLSDRPIRSGDEWSLNLLRADGPPARRRYLAFSPTYTPVPDFHVPSRFVRIRFVE